MNGTKRFFTHLSLMGAALGLSLLLAGCSTQQAAPETRFVLLDGVGRAVVRGASDETVREVIEAHCA